MHETSHPRAKKGQRWRQWLQCSSWRRPFASSANGLHHGEGGGRSRLAFATHDGVTLGATLETASSFVLYERSASGIRYTGVIGCGFSEPGGRAAAMARREALSAVDRVFVFDPSGSPDLDRRLGRSRLVRSSSIRLIAELLRELSPLGAPELALDTPPESPATSPPGCARA